MPFTADRKKLHWASAAVMAIVLAPAGAGPSGAQEARQPTAVSPGSPVAAERLAGSCPTFSWSGSRDASGYELVLYQVTDRGTLESVFQIEVAGDARAWTPSAASCPASGGQFAWAVRALGSDGAGEWSEPLLFETAGPPSEDEVRQALETLRRYRQERPEGAGEGDGPLAVASLADCGRAGFPCRLPPEETSPFPEDRASEGLEALTSATVGLDPPQQIIGTPSFSLSLEDDVDLGGSVFKEGYPFIHNDGGAAFRNTAVGINALVSVSPTPTEGIHNSALGYRALFATTSGLRNTAAGSRALQNNTSGSNNTATGYLALYKNSTGDFNTAAGKDALTANTTGSYNTALGLDALEGNTTGDSNTALGTHALESNTSGFSNTAVGRGALSNNSFGSSNTATGRGALRSTSGHGNTAVGEDALALNTVGSFNTAVGLITGSEWTTGDFNIGIGVGAYGISGESGTIRIGGNGRQTKTHIEGISGTSVSGVAVMITAGDQLGVAASSSRFKQDVHDLEGVSDRLQVLRPVSFHYKDDLIKLPEGAENPLEYGLIAEEVARVFPELVVNDEEGEPYTVRYHLLTPLLLSEIQRQEGEVEALRRQMADRDRVVADLQRRLEKLARKNRFR